MKFDYQKVPIRMKNSGTSMEFYKNLLMRISM